MFLFDVYTNFICVVLTYQSFSKYYTIFCKFGDNKCKLCCSIMIGGEYHKKSIKSMEITVDTAYNTDNSNINQPESTKSPRTPPTTNNEYLSSPHKLQQVKSDSGACTTDEDDDDDMSNETDERVIDNHHPQMQFSVSTAL